MHKKQQAFTLLELTIVLVVIAVMTVGIFKGAGLVNSSKISVARSLTERSPVPKIDGLVVWYETTSIDSLLKSEASNNSTVTTWYDLSPASVPLRKNTLTAKTGAVKYIKNGINNLPSLSFSYEGDPSVTTLQLASFYQGSNSQSTVFFVFKEKYKSSSNASYLLDAYSSDPYYQIFYNESGSSDNIRIYTGSATSNSVTASLIQDERDHILAVYVDRSYSKAYLNDASSLVGGAYFAVNPGSNALKSLTIGATKDDANNTRFVGLLSEIIIYNRVLKNDERKDIFTYLSKKYSIPVAGI